VVDHFSKFVLKAMKEATTAAVIQFLTKEVLNTFEVPEIIHSDNGKQFLEMTQNQNQAHENSD